MVELKDKEGKILELIKRHKKISKYQLWKISDYYSYSTVWNIVENLKSKGLIKEEISMSKNNKTVVMVSLK